MGLFRLVVFSLVFTIIEFAVLAAFMFIFGIFLWGLEFILPAGWGPLGLG